MNTAFLETLLRIAQLGSFRQAARQLGATQAAVSQRIAVLEEELGAALIERGTRPVRLTAAGERALPVAERLLSLERELRASVHPDAAPAGRVRVGVIESVVHTWLTALIRRIAERAPAVELDLTVDTARNLRERLRQRELDVLYQNDPLDLGPRSADYTVTPLCRYPIHWIARPGLLPARKLELEDLARVPVITFSTRSSPQLQLRALFEAEGIEARITSCPSVAGILKLTVEGFGVAAIPPLFVRAELRRERLYKHRGPALPPLGISLAHARSAAPMLQLLASESRATVADYCARAGARWATYLAG